MNSALNQNNLPWNWNVYYFFFGKHEDDVWLLLSGFLLDCVVVSIPLPEDPLLFVMQLIMTLIGAYARRRYMYLDNLLFKEFASFLMLAIMFITGHQLLMSALTMLISAFLAIHATKRKPLVQESIETSLAVILFLTVIVFGTHPFTVIYAILTSVFSPFSVMLYLKLWTLTFEPEVKTTTSNGNETSFITSNDAAVAATNSTN
ncbi:hypothetical protein TSAR_001032 [Trichomalopsis sarcophagae]|uniref:Uncharacterized protein n=1 Tax=Trichomalopsis sarcophagae TaxID=543379 RepID=A0A232FLW1_9HYME|nr:hypothetical protein TSAR_001032 [Trichomalopsis sarcophagae]